MVNHNHVVASLSAKESGLAGCSGVEAPEQCHPASGAALVMQYVGDRTETQNNAGQDAAAELAARVQQLESRLSSLMTYTGQLEEAIRQMQIGFRRHRSERVHPDQLNMALTFDADATEVRAEDACVDGDERTARCNDDATSVSEQTTTDTESCGSQGDSCTPPAPPKRHRHGRRKVRAVPQLIVQILPPEVLIDGLHAYKQIGHEDASLIGYRRGGPVELVMRRPKFVRLEADPSQSGADAASATDADTAADGGERAPRKPQRPRASRSRSSSTSFSACRRTQRFSTTPSWMAPLCAIFRSSSVSSKPRPRCSSLRLRNAR